MTNHNKIAIGLLIVVIASTVNAYASDANTVRAVQLMLSLKGYDLGYGDSKGIDGKLGQITREAIKDYQAKKQLTPTGHVDKWLYDSLYEDIKSKPTTPPPVAKVPPEPETDDSKKINALSGELNTTKDDLKNTNAELKTLKDSISANFFSSYTGLVAILITTIGIALGLLGALLAWYVPKTIEDIKGETRKIHDEKIKQANELHEQLREKSRSIIEYAIYLKLSRAFYLYYAFFLSPPNDPDKVKHELKGGASLAIWFIDNAIESMRLHPEEELRDHYIEYAKTHRAYHFASKSIAEKLSEQDKNDAILEAFRLKNLANNYFNKGKINEWIEFMDTVVWIFILLGNDDQRTEGRELLKKLASHDTFIKECGKNYRLIGEEQYL